MNYIGTKEPLPVEDLWDHHPCVRCDAPSQCQWMICANDRNFVPLCIDCDIELNFLVLSFLGFVNPQSYIDAYKAKLKEDGLLEDGCNTSTD